MAMRRHSIVLGNAPMRLATPLQVIRRKLQRRLKARRHKPLPQRWMLLLRLLLAAEAVLVPAYRLRRRGPEPKVYRTVARGDVGDPRSVHASKA